ncbi:MAG TPA: hypothetical protein VK497_00430 [Candidatus Saccharimonadales bacterium]|nr:hypothetical protein [Candidatus Saccharimonadales bacterium]
MRASKPIMLQGFTERSLREAVSDPATRLTMIRAFSNRRVRLSARIWDKTNGLYGLPLVVPPEYGMTREEYARDFRPFRKLERLVLLASPLDMLLISLCWAGRSLSRKMRQFRR